MKTQIVSLIVLVLVAYAASGGPPHSASVGGPVSEGLNECVYAAITACGKGNVCRVRSGHDGVCEIQCRDVNGECPPAPVPNDDEVDVTLGDNFDTSDVGGRDIRFHGGAVIVFTDGEIVWVAAGEVHSIFDEDLWTRMDGGTDEQAVSLWTR